MVHLRKTGFKGWPVSSQINQDRRHQHPPPKCSGRPRHCLRSRREGVLLRFDRLMNQPWPGTRPRQRCPPSHPAEVWSWKFSIPGCRRRDHPWPPDSAGRHRRHTETSAPWRRRRGPTGRVCIERSTCLKSEVGLRECFINISSSFNHHWTVMLQPCIVGVSIHFVSNLKSNNNFFTNTIIYNILLDFINLTRMIRYVCP